MKKLAAAFAFIFLFIAGAQAQHKKSDTLLVALQKANTDTARYV